MPSEPQVPISLVREIVKVSVDQAIAGTRTGRILTGTVEDLDDETLDVAWIRMDTDATSSDPTQSDNWDNPGIIPTTRIGETLVGEQVRVSFDPRAGATSNRTGVENRIVLPFGAETGQRIILDGNTGTFEFYDENDNLVGFWDATQLYVGTDGGLLVRLDPFGGLRIWDENDQIRLTASATEGLQVRDPVSGITGVAVRQEGIIISDPDTGESISIASGQAAAVPVPRWAALNSDTSPGVTHSTPAVDSFETGDDLDLRFVAASAPSNLGTQSYTPPASYTERADPNSPGDISLAVSLASRQPALAAPGVADFTNTSAAFTRQLGHSMIVQGGGATSPAIYRISSPTAQTFADKTIPLTIAVGITPSDGDLLAVHVVLAGGAIPVGWQVPEEWTQLGVLAAGLGTSHVLGSGIWYKRWRTGDSTSWDVLVNMTAALPTKVQTTMVQISNPYVYPAGLDIRRNNRSMPRGLIGEATDPNTIGPLNASTGGLPHDMLEITGVELKAGRSYLLEFSGIARSASLNTGMIWSPVVQKDTGTGYTTVARLATVRYGQTGTYEFPLQRGMRYVPAADETADFRIRLTDVGTNNAYSVTFLSSAFGIDETAFRITDQGAEY